MERHGWPEWWDWELEFTPHLLKRMLERQFNEVDLRTMLEYAQAYHQDVVADRWVIETRYEGYPWEVIIEPDIDSELLVVVTAYPVWEEK